MPTTAQLALAATMSKITSHEDPQSDSDEDVDLGPQAYNPITHGAAAARTMAMPLGFSGMEQEEIEKIEEAEAGGGAGELG
jgi:hypothetical protein